MKELTQEYLRDVLSYDPDTGIFVWIKGPFPGKVTGCPNRGGYLRISIGGRLYYSHRLAWLYVYGVTKNVIDHINGIRTDNRIVNLRECTQSQNCFNSGMRKRNASGFKGVHWCNRDKKWIAKIRFDGIRQTIGYFSTPEDAGAAYAARAREVHGEFYRANP